MAIEMVTVTICGIKTEVHRSWKRLIDYMADYPNVDHFDYPDLDHRNNFWTNVAILRDRYRRELGLPI